jgi:WD40 repeat protein/tetratricopeptide (TPR) repeat protein
VYSLGATLWEVLTLRPLFEATDTTPTPDLMLKIQSSDPVPPRRYNPRVPADLEAIVQKCLEKERTRRYATARELAEDLDRWLNGAPVQAQPPTLGYLLGKSVRRHRVGIAVASLLVLTIVLGATAAAAINVLITVSRARDNVKKALGETRVARDEANHARHREQEAREKVETARRRIESLENERRLRLVRIAVTNGVQLREKGDVSGALAWFADALRIESDTSTPDPRREEAHRLRIASLLRQIPKLTHVFHHDDVIYEANFSRDGQSVVTASKDGTARVWDAESGQQRVILRHGEHLYGAAFSPDGRRIVTDGGNLARIWTADSGQQVAVLKLRDWAHSPATFSPDSRRLLTRSWKTAQVWDSDTGRRLAEFEQGGAGIESARFDPEGKRIIMTLDNDIIAHILDVSSGQQCAELRHDNLQRDWYADFSPDGRLAVTCCLGGKVFIWNATSGQRILSLSHGSSSGACHAEFSPDGRRLITKGSGVVRLWEVQSGRHLAEFKDVDGSIDAWSRPYARRVVTHESDGTARVRDLDSDRVLAVLRHGENVRSASFSPDGRRILTASDDGTSCIWDLASNSDEVLFSSRLTVGSVAYSRDGRHILTTQIGGGPATVWDADTGYEIAVLVHEAPLKGAEFSADGRRVLTFGGGTARVWDVHSGRSLVVLEHGKSISSARFGPDANRVVTAGWDGTAQVWDTNSRQRLVTLRHGDHVENACFSPDGRRILSISGDSLRSTLRIWEAGSGRELGRGDFEDKVSSACFNSDGSRFLTACQDGIAEVFDGESFQPLLELRGPGRLAGASFSPDGRRITTFNGGGLARLWDAMSGRLLSELKHCENMKDAVFSPDGRRVLTSGGGMATLWDVDAGQEIAVFRNQKGVFGGGFSPDGQRVVIAGGDGAASVWNLAVDGRPVGDLIRLAQLYAMTQISPIGDLVPLRTAEAMENWKALRTVYPVDFRPRSQDVLQWHRHEAITCEANQGWISPVPHLNALIKAEPGSWSLRERRSWALIPLGMWAKAADDLTRALELRPDKVDLHAWRAAAYAELGQWPPAEEDIREAINGNKQSSDPLMSLARRQRFLALIKLGQGDLPGYRMACRALLESIRDATWHYYDISAPAFVAAPDAIDDWESVFSRLRTAYKELKSNDLQRREDVGLLGMIAYRSGRTEEAIGYLGDAVAAHFPKGESAQPMRNPFDKGNLCMLPPEGGAATEWLFLAMAHQRLGHGQEGQSFLAKATLALDRIALDQPMNVSAGRILDWQDRLTLRLLRREAEKLLSKDAATPSDPET